MGPEDRQKITAEHQSATAAVCATDLHSGLALPRFFFFLHLSRIQSAVIPWDLTLRTLQYLTKIICKVDRESLSIKPSFKTKLGTDLSNTLAEGNKRELFSVCISGSEASLARLHFKANSSTTTNKQAHNLQLFLFWNVRFRSLFVFNDQNANEQLILYQT